MKYLIQTRQEGPKDLATVSKEGPVDQREGPSWQPLHVALASTEDDAVRAVLREWQDGQVGAQPYATAGPHSRACGIHWHPHGPRCADDCPSCGS